ncbi:MAG: Ig-like domain-containing protein [Candidatus Sulfotelmatobacter sp.]
MAIASGPASASTTITVNKAAPAISWAAPAAITYGTALSSTQLDASSGGVAGTFVYTPSANTVLDAGVGQTLSVAFTPNNATNYNPASASTTITVNKAAPAIALASTAGTVLAKTPVTFTATVSSSAGTPSGSVDFYDGTTSLGQGTLALGVATYTTSNLTDGSHSITAAYGGNIDFSALTSTAITETVDDFAVSIPSGSSNTATVSPGGSASYTLNIAPSGNATFLSAITLAVSGLPVGATAKFTPQALAAGAGATNVALAIQVPGQSSSLRHSDRLVLQLSPLMVGLLLLPFASRLRRPSQSGRWRQIKGGLSVVLLASAVAASLVGLGGCGAPSSVSPGSTSYILAITATSGSLSRSTTVALVVE